MARRISRTRASRTSRHVTLVSRHAFCFLSGISERQLEVWEREDFIRPARFGDSTTGNEPLYDREALRRARVIRTLQRGTRRQPPRYRRDSAIFSSSSLR